jgi:ribosomal protein L11 methyltransferase
VLAYFADDPRIEDELASSLRGLDVEIAPVPIPDVDWVARVREGFRPFQVGSFRVVPAWEPPSSFAAGGDGHLLVVEPGLAFGTGTHESTRLCLAALEALADEGPLGDLLDVGAGSGILSAAAARLGARRVVAVEIDEEALPVARRHAELNRAAIRLVRGDGARPIRPGSFDLVVANLSAPLLIERAPELLEALREGGHLVLSGLLSEDARAVGAACRGAALLATRAEGAWSALVLRRQGQRP